MIELTEAERDVIEAVANQCDKARCNCGDPTTASSFADSAAVLRRLLARDAENRGKVAVSVECATTIQEGLGVLQSYYKAIGDGASLKTELEELESAIAEAEAALKKEE